MKPVGLLVLTSLLLTSGCVSQVDRPLQAGLRKPVFYGSNPGVHPTDADKQAVVAVVQAAHPGYCVTAVSFLTADQVSIELGSTSDSTRGFHVVMNRTGSLWRETTGYDETMAP